MTAASHASPRPWLARLFAAATVAYTGVLLFATHYPRPEELLGPNPPSDKALHFLAYGMLASLATATWLTSRRLAGRSLGGLAILLALFGGLDEITQPLFRRSADPLDWIYDCIGIGTGVIAVLAAAAVAGRLGRAGQSVEQRQ